MTKNKSLKDSFTINIQGMIYLNTILFNGASYSEKIDNWFDSLFYQTFKSLENLFITDCLQIDIKN